MRWILGSEGMLGSQVISLLRAKKIPFVATSRKDADVSSYESLEHFSRGKEISQIINCSAYTKVDLAEREKDLAYAVNALGPQNIGRLARILGIKVIHFSTDYVFGGEKKSPYREEDIPQPLNTYGQSKREGEERLLAENPSSCILRTSWLFGFSGEHFVSKMLKIMREKEEIKIVDDQRGRPTFCEDLAESLLSLSDVSGIFHFANHGETSWFQFAKCIYEEAKALKVPLICKKLHPIPSKEYPLPAQRPLYSVLDTSKIERLLGLQPRPWQEAVRQYLRFL